MADLHAAHWYALKIFYNRVSGFREQLEHAGWRTYVPAKVVEIYEGGSLHYVEKPIIQSLLFVHCPEETVLALKRGNDAYLMYYADFATGRPSVIPDREMEVFILVTSVQDKGLEYLGADAPEYHEGERVRVTGGIYKGAEGYIKRIKKDRKLVVCVSGVAVVATSFIHPSYLERI